MKQGLAQYLTTSDLPQRDYQIGGTGSTRTCGAGPARPRPSLCDVISRRDIEIRYYIGMTNHGDPHMGRLPVADTRIRRKRNDSAPADMYYGRIEGETVEENSPPLHPNLNR